jgi:hypothetical protein
VIWSFVLCEVPLKILLDICVMCVDFGGYLAKEAAKIGNILKNINKFVGATSGSRGHHQPRRSAGATWATEQGP